MKEKVGFCIRCSQELFCIDGFFNGVTLEKGNSLCFDCAKDDPLIKILNQLLEAEKAGVETLDYMLSTFPKEAMRDPFTLVKQDEAWSCSGLIRSIRREGGSPSKLTGIFTEKVKAEPTLEQKLALLNKGQSWVARKIGDALKWGMDEETREFLTEMKRRHENNIEMMSKFVQP